MTFICGSAAPAQVMRVLTGMTSCCVGALEDGPASCECWVPIYDLEQQPIAESLTPGQRTEMCADCAYRPDSPERTGDDRHTCSDDGELDDIARGDNPFWCHQGLRKPTAFRHETLGIIVPTDSDAYDPPFAKIDGRRIPIKADGSAGDRCAGWMARKRQLTAPEPRKMLRLEPYLCAGCNVRGVHEHRCFGDDAAWMGDPRCECPEPMCRVRQRRT